MMMIYRVGECDKMQQITEFVLALWLANSATIPFELGSIPASRHSSAVVGTLDQRTCNISTCKVQQQMALATQDLFYASNSKLTTCEGSSTLRTTHDMWYPKSVTRGPNKKGQ